MTPTLSLRASAAESFASSAWFSRRFGSTKNRLTGGNAPAMTVERLHGPGGAAQGPVGPHRTLPVVGGRREALERPADVLGRLLHLLAEVLQMIRPRRFPKARQRVPDGLLHPRHRRRELRQFGWMKVPAEVGQGLHTLHDRRQQRGDRIEQGLVVPGSGVAHGVLPNETIIVPFAAPTTTAIPRPEGTAPMSEARQFDRAEENIGNVLNMEHINLTVPDQQLAALFYVTGLGFTRDPYIDFGTFNMWVNTGEQQFHLPKNTAQRWRGHIGVVVPSLEDLQRRLRFVAKPLADTAFAWEEQEDHVRVTCPWGNDIRVHGPERFPGRYLGIPYARDAHPRGHGERGRPVLRTGLLDARHGARRQRRTPRGGLDGASTNVSSIGKPRTTSPITTGTTSPSTLWTSARPHAYLAEHGLVTEESDQHQYRFQAVVDPDTGDTITELEHEVRSLRHPMFKRNLVNRNPAQTFFNYRDGRDAFYPG